jgi:hypothetical protein
LVFERRVWAVKLHPRGGAHAWNAKQIKNELARLNGELGSHLDEDTVRSFWRNADESARYCHQNKIIGIGCALKPKKEFTHEVTWDQFQRECVDTDWFQREKSNTGRSEGKIPIYVKLFHEVREGDLCWVRDEQGRFCVCGVKGPWEYVGDAEHWARDLVQIHCAGEWVPIGDATQAPAEAVEKLTTRGATVTEIEDKQFAELTEFLYGQPHKLQDYIEMFDREPQKYIPALSQSEALERRTWYDYEDLVGVYLQNQGYYILPSSRTPNAKDFEFMLYREGDRGGIERATVQVKHQSGKLRAMDYAEKAKRFDRVYLACTGGVDFTGVPNPTNIEEVDNNELIKFMWKHVGSHPRG